MLLYGYFFPLSREAKNVTDLPDVGYSFTKIRRRKVTRTKFIYRPVAQSIAKERKKCYNTNSLTPKILFQY